MTAINARFMNNNFLESTLTYSSQLTNFPASNAINKSRSRVWSFGGNFEITSANNFLYINDGSAKTITLTAASYTYNTLASHIQTQLNASSSNWTCTYDASTAFKFSINRTSGTAILKLSSTSAAVWDTLGFTGATDLSTPAFVANEQRNHTSEWLQCDMGAQQTATFVSLLSGIDQTFALSELSTVTVQANNIDLWTSPAFSIVIPWNKLGIFGFFDSTSSDYRYWRVVVQDRLNTLGPTGITIAYAYIGDHVTVTNTNIASGITRSLNDPSNTLQSENGALFVETKARYASYSSCQIQLITGNEKRAIEQFFYDVGVRTPFFISFDPGLNITSSLAELTNWVVMTQAPTFVQVFAAYFNISFSMREAF